VRLGVSVILLGLPAPTVGQTAPPTLNFEQLLALEQPTSTTGTVELLRYNCDSAAGERFFSYRATGFAAGPYPGTFVETGRVVFGDAPTVVESIEIDFRIMSSVGNVEGRSWLPEGIVSTSGTCTENQFGQPFNVGVNFSGLRYEATITTGAGTYRDQGFASLTSQVSQIIRDGQPVDFNTINHRFGPSDFVQPEPAGPAIVSLTPPAATNEVGTEHTVTATATTATGSPVSNVTILFTVAGSVETSGSCTTGSDGTCAFSYSGPALPGADIITACADNDGDGEADLGQPCGEATKAWILPVSTAGHVTGGGHVLSAVEGMELAFGFVAKSDQTGTKGHCNVVDKFPVTNVHIKCVTVDTLVQAVNMATFFGQAEVNGVLTNYRIDVMDNGEPGAGRDTFTIQTGSGYTAGGVVDNGNIQVHEDKME
jgi:hypothetical protein